MAQSLAIKVIIKGKDALSGMLRGLGGRIRGALGRLTLRGVALAPLRGMRAVLGGITRVAGGAARMLGSIAKPLGILGAASIGAAVGIYKLVSAQAKALGAGSEFARLTGVSFEGLQELRYAADQSGVSAEEFDAALRKLNKGMGEFRTGKGGLAGFVKTLPKDFQKTLASTKGNEEALGLLFNALDAIKDPAKKAAFATKFFGKSGDKPALMAAGGADAVAKLREEARKWGVASTEAGQNAETFGDSQAKLKASINGVKNVIAEKLLPVMTPLIDRMAEFFADSSRREAIGNKIKEMFERIAASLAGMNWAAIGNGIAKALDIGWGLLTGFVQLMTGLLNGDWATVIQGLGDAWNAIKGPLEQVWEWIRKGFDTLLDYIVEQMGTLPDRLINQTVADALGVLSTADLRKAMEKRQRQAELDIEGRAGNRELRQAGRRKAAIAQGLWDGNLGPAPAPAPTAIPGGTSKIEVTIKADEGTTVTTTKATGPAAKGFRHGPTGVNWIFGGAR